MAYPQAHVPPRTNAQLSLAQAGRPTIIEMGPEQKPMTEQRVPEEPTGPPEDVYPCGCAYPGPHKTDCMWSLWEQMRDNYNQTRTLMGKFMSQVNTMQETAGKETKCECPSGCHGADLGEAMGLHQMAGVTVPWNMGLGGPMRQGASGAATQSYPVENEARKLMEEQQRIKRTWLQFFNIFDMALDLANDVSKDRWKQNQNRKERQRLEREQRLEEMRKERQERQKGSKPSPPPLKEEKPSKDTEENKKEEQQPQEKKEEEGESEPPKEDQSEEPTQDEPAAEAAAEEEEEGE